MVKSRKLQSDFMSEFSKKNSVGPVNEDLSDLRPAKRSSSLDDFSCRWQSILGEIKDFSRYSDEVTFGGWHGQKTAALPRDSQADIDKIKQSISSKNILVINHGYCSGLDQHGWIDRNYSQEEREYFANLEALIRIRDGEKAQAVMFDYPEHYVLSSRDRLMAKEIDSVILTPYSTGGSLLPQQAYKEIGEAKNIFLAGAYLPCLATTAEELWLNNNEIFIIEDAAHLGEGDYFMARSHREQFRADIRVDQLHFIKTTDFLRTFS
jgi:hypothetical protein